MDLDAVFLARMQFAFTVTFHIVFPVFTIGLASYLAVLEALWLKTGRELYMDLFKYWISSVPTFSSLWLVNAGFRSIFS